MLRELSVTTGSTADQDGRAALVAAAQKQIGGRQQRSFGETSVLANGNGISPGSRGVIMLADLGGRHLSMAPT